MSKIKVTRRTYLFCIDFLIALASYLAIIAIGAIFGEGYQGVYAYAISFAVFAICIFVSRLIFKTYVNVWRYANSTNYIKIVAADIIGGGIFTVIFLFVDCRS